MHRRPAIRPDMLVKRSMRIGELFAECTDDRLELKVFATPFGLISTDYGSFRGRYNQAALQPAFTWRDTHLETVAQLKKVLEELMSEEFTGYKGGIFRYDEYTPLWFSPWGETRMVGPIDVLVNELSMSVVMWPIGKPENW